MSTASLINRDASATVDEYLTLFCGCCGLTANDAPFSFVFGTGVNRISAVVDHRFVGDSGDHADPQPIRLL